MIDSDIQLMSKKVQLIALKVAFSPEAALLQYYDFHPVDR